MKQVAGKNAPARAPLPLLDGLTGWDYYVESSKRADELFDVYGLPRPGSPGKIPGLMGGFTPVSAEDSWRRLALAVIRDYVRSCKPVRPPGPLAEIAKAKAAMSGRPPPNIRRGLEPRFPDGEVLNMVAKQMAETGQCQTTALADLFDSGDGKDDSGSYKRFLKIKKEHPDKWETIRASHLAEKSEVALE